MPARSRAEDQKAVLDAAEKVKTTRGSPANKAARAAAAKAAAKHAANVRADTKAQQKAANAERRQAGRRR